MLHVPRNEGACLWAPSVPFSTAPACTVNTSSFSCHLHTNGAFTLERSKSDVQAHRHLHAEYVSRTTFYTNNSETTKIESDQNTVFSLERSKTSAILPGSLNPIDKTIFDNRPPYSRAAPSPPVRKKLSPNCKRSDISNEVKLLAEQGRFLGTTGILLAEIPVPPRRKVSPKSFENNVPKTSNNEQNSSSDDLITF